MIIRILPPDKIDLDTVSMHNLVKRNAEDLRRRLPSLQECIVKLSPLTALSIRNGNANKIDTHHILNSDETAITIVMRCKLPSGKELLEENIARELKRIMNTYD